MTSPTFKAGVAFAEHRVQQRSSTACARFVCCNSSFGGASKELAHEVGERRVLLVRIVLASSAAAPERTTRSSRERAGATSSRLSTPDRNKGTPTTAPGAVSHSATWPLESALAGPCIAPTSNPPTPMPVRPPHSIPAPRASSLPAASSLVTTIPPRTNTMVTASPARASQLFRDRSSLVMPMPPCVRRTPSSAAKLHRLRQLRLLQLVVRRPCDYARPSSCSAVSPMS